MPNKNPKKQIIAAALCVIGVIFLAYASCTKKKSDNTISQPITPTTLPQPPTPSIEPSTVSGQLGAVHGVGNQDQLVALPSRLTQKDEYVHADAYQPLMAMIKHAEQDGIRLSVVSAYRSYDHQKRIWENKWGNADNADTQKALKILEYSSFPGTSRHHWGTDIDFNSVNLSYWQSDEGRRVHQWLSQNAPQYGFCQTYGYDRSGGYAVEDWHWSHMPTAEQFYHQINNPQVLAVATSQPVKGATAVRELNNQLFGYIQGISPCPNKGQPIQQQPNHPTSPQSAPTTTLTSPTQTTTAQPTTQPTKPKPLPQKSDVPQSNINGQQGGW